jgi:Tol biopolymer transport system component
MRTKNTHRSRFATTLAALAAATLVATAKAQPGDPAIAFRGTVKNKTGIAVCNADGTNATVIRTAGLGIQFSWSPDGASIAFIEPSPIEVWRIDVSVVNGVPQGSNALRLLGGDGYSYSTPAWSPLGDVIIARRTPVNAPDTQGVFVTVPSTGGTPTVIYQPPAGAAVHSPAWNFDASRIAFTERLPGSTANNIMALDLASGIKTMVLDVGPSGLWPTAIEWARTGDSLAFEASSGVYTLDTSVGVPVLVEPVGSSPCWSPDDNELLFVGAQNRIKRINLTTGAITILGPKGTWTDWRRF